MSQLYLQFLRLAQVVETQNTAVRNIDSNGLLLLNEIALQHFAGKTLSVTQAMALKKLASPATLHRKIDALREAGLIEQIFVGKNRRTKYLVPTKDTHAYFAKLSKAIMSAVNS